MLQQQLFKKQEYIVSLFLSNCDKNKEACDNILEELEKVRNNVDLNLQGHYKDFYVPPQKTFMNEKSFLKG